MRIIDVNLPKNTWVTIPNNGEYIALISITGAGNAVWRFKGDGNTGVEYDTPIYTDQDLEVMALRVAMLAKVVEA